MIQGMTGKILLFLFFNERMADGMFDDLNLRYESENDWKNIDILIFHSENG